MALNRPIQIPLGHAVILLIVLPTLVCISRMAWGRSVMFDSSVIEFLRGRSKLLRIPRNGVEKVTVNKKAISFKYQLDGQTRFKSVCREGFSESAWQELADCARSYAGHTKAD
jgi:hypothetical protein